MKSLKIVILTLVASLIITPLAHSVELSIDAINNPDSQIPPSFAKIIKDEDSEKIVFNSSGVHYDAKALNAIFEGYGLKLPANKLDDNNSTVPRSFARVVEKEEQKVIIFSDDGTMYGPSALNAILNAYGVSLSVSAIKADDSKIPNSFAKILKDGEDEKIVFNESSVFYSPSALNEILMSYQ